MKFLMGAALTEFHLSVRGIAPRVYDHSAVSFPVRGVCFFAKSPSGSARDGTRSPANYNLEINLRYNQNTVEQVILAAIAWFGLAVTLPVRSLYLIPAMAAAFVVGRARFWDRLSDRPDGARLRHGGDDIAHHRRVRLALWRAFVG
jgi:hypothetical protein